MSLPWFRLYSEFSGDPVIQSLAFEDQRHYVILLCMKCNGLLDRKIAPSRRESIIARGLGLDPLSCDEAKKRLMEVNLIDKKWHPIAWDKRQFISDNSTERTRKYRKNKETGNVTRASQERHRDGPEQNRTEQNRTDTLNPSWLNQAAWDEFVQHRKDIRKPLTKLAAKKNMGVLAEHPNYQQSIVDKTIANGWAGLFPPKGKRSMTAVERAEKANQC